MRVTRTVFVSAVAAIITLALPVAPVHADGPGDNRALAAEAAAYQGQTNPGVAVALSRIQENIARHVSLRGAANSFGSFIDPSTGRIVLQTNAPPGIVSALVGAHGGLVDVRAATIEDAVSRKSDVPPFSGGSGVTDGGGICTSRFVVKNSIGVRSLTTAGNCFDRGAAVLTETGGVDVGKATQNGLPSGYDMELIVGKTYQPRIYLGGVDGTTTAAVGGAGDPVANALGYCHSGRTSGEHCNHTVLSVTAQVCTQSGCKSPVISWTGGNIIQPGDSGSPFFIKSGGKVFIRGMNIAPRDHLRQHRVSGDRRGAFHRSQ